MERRSRELESGPGAWSAPGARRERSGSASFPSRSRTGAALPDGRRSRDDGREPRKYGTPEQIARRSISEAGAAGAWMSAPGDEESGEAAPPAAAPAAAASSLMAIADDDARRFSLSNPLAA